MAPPAAPKPQGAGVADEVATAATDVAGEVLGVDVVRAPAGPADDLRKLKGVGPKFVARLNELGIIRFDQLAGLNANEVAHLDERMGPFQGRLAKDRIIEQADLLARRDIETLRGEVREIDAIGVIPAQAGISWRPAETLRPEIPAFAGTTRRLRPFAPA